MFAKRFNFCLSVFGDSNVVDYFHGVSTCRYKIAKRTFFSSVAHLVYNWHNCRYLQVDFTNTDAVDL